MAGGVVACDRADGAVLSATAAASWSVAKGFDRAILAIERDRFHLLPGGIFRRTDSHAYAEAVGLDGPACVRPPALAIAVATILAVILALAAFAFAEA